MVPMLEPLPNLDHFRIPQIQFFLSLKAISINLRCANWGSTAMPELMPNCLICGYYNIISFLDPEMLVGGISYVIVPFRVFF